MNELSKPHRINLSAMWRTDDDPGSSKVNLQELDWGSIDQTQLKQGPITFSRSFNRPTNLDEHSRVTLELTGLPVDTCCNFNGQEIGRCEGIVCEFDVTELLISGQNRIQIEVRNLTGTKSPAGVVLILQ